MSVGYTHVQWNRHKRVYDALIAAGVVAYVAAFAGVSAARWNGDEAYSAEVLAIRATGSCALVLLHVILCIGPLARLEPRFAPFLYNRRHLGVCTFLIALVHAVLVVGYYHGFGPINPLVSLVRSNTNYGSVRAFPFEMLGAGALAVLFVLAATSHDFWLKNLSASVWKRMHMLVYGAYGLLVGHVALGALMTGRGVGAPTALGLGILVVGVLHIVAGAREARRDRGCASGSTEGWIDAGIAEDIPMDRARTICTESGERIAVFRTQDSISAITNRCAHQGGPLGEGRVIDGCVTCPWHGWQYRPGDGCSPPPFQEKIATYNVRITAGRVMVDPRANAPGTATTPARIENGQGVRANGDDLYVGYLPLPAAHRALVRRVVPLLLVGLSVIGAAWASAQRSPGRGVWDDATVRTFEGRVVGSPYPALVGAREADGTARTLLLVESGKHGAQERTRAHEGRIVRVRGYLLSRGGMGMLELVPGPGAIEVTGKGAAAEATTEGAGMVRVRGEIVDAKCYLGAMKPGEGKTHKACAALCIGAGIPPLFVERAGDGTERVYVLCGENGGAARADVFPFVGDPVEVEGAGWTWHGLPALRVRGAGIRREARHE